MLGRLIELFGFAEGPLGAKAGLNFTTNQVLRQRQVLSVRHANAARVGVQNVEGDALSLHDVGDKGGEKHFGALLEVVFGDGTFDEGPDVGLKAPEVHGDQ